MPSNDRPDHHEFFLKIRYIYGFSFLFNFFFLFLPVTIIVEVTVARERDQGTATDTEGIENLRSGIRPDIGGLQGGPFWHDEPKRAVQGTFQRHTCFFFIINYLL